MGGGVRKLVMRFICLHMVEYHNKGKFNTYIQHNSEVI